MAVSTVSCHVTSPIEHMVAVPSIGWHAIQYLKSHTLHGHTIHQSAVAQSEFTQSPQVDGWLGQDAPYLLRLCRKPLRTRHRCHGETTGQSFLASATSTKLHQRIGGPALLLPFLPRSSSLKVNQQPTRPSSEGSQLLKTGPDIVTLEIERWYPNGIFRAKEGFVSLDSISTNRCSWSALVHHPLAFKHNTLGTDDHPTRHCLCLSPSLCVMNDLRHHPSSMIYLQLYVLGERIKRPASQFEFNFNGPMFA